MPPTPTTIADGVSYLCHPHHRNNHPHKSQWTISVHDEIRSFRKARSNDWFCGEAGWGIHPDAPDVIEVGAACDRSTRLMLAKYVCKNDQGEWHGYPANHQLDQDRPPDTIVRIWFTGKIIPRAKLRKIQKGQLCSL